MTEIITRYNIEQESVQLVEHQLSKLDTGDVQYQSVLLEEYDTEEEARAKFEKCYSETQVIISKSNIGRNLYDITKYSLVRVEYELIDGEEEETDREYLAQSKDNFEF